MTDQRAASTMPMLGTDGLTFKRPQMLRGQW